MPATQRELTIIQRVREVALANGDVTREVTRLRREGFTTDETTSPLTKLWERLKREGEM